MSFQNIVTSAAICRIPICDKSNRIRNGWTRIYMGFVGSGSRLSMCLVIFFVNHIETEEETAIMKLKKAMACVGATVVLGGAALSASAANNGFAALQGIEAQPLSIEEMQAISGQLNALDIAAALTAKAATLDAFPKLQAAVLKLAAYYTTNADAINALFMKLGVYTAPK